MDESGRYLTDAAHKISNWYGKPLAIIATMAFLFVCTGVILTSGFSPIWYFVIYGAATIINLLLVGILQYAHNNDIRTLQARMDALAADLKAAEQKADAGRLSDSELQQARDILKQHRDGEQAMVRSNRDRRPSLF